MCASDGCKKNAILHGDLSETVCMRLPPGYTRDGALIHVTAEGEEQRLQSSLADGFKQSKSDYTLFIKQFANSIIVILVYVDDILIAGTHIHHISTTKQFLHSQFHMKDLGPIRYILGIEVDQVPQGFFLSQKKYTLDLLQSYNMQSCKPLKLPMDPKLQLNSGKPLPKVESYQRLIGKLIYLTITRPHISYTVHVLSQFMHSPTDVQYQADLRVLRYLSGSSSQGIFLNNDFNAKLTSFCDSD